MNSARSKSLSSEYKRFTPSGCKVIGMKKFDFLAIPLNSITRYQLNDRRLIFFFLSCNFTKDLVKVVMCNRFFGISVNPIKNHKIMSTILELKEKRR